MESSADIADFPSDIWFWLFVSVLAAFSGFMVYILYFGPESSCRCSGSKGRSSSGDDEEQDFLYSNKATSTMHSHRDRMGQQTYYEVTGDNLCPGTVSGLQMLRDPRLNKGTCFTLEERQSLGIHGMLPPRIKTQEEQVALCKANLERYQDSLDRYVYLASLQDLSKLQFFLPSNEGILHCHSGQGNNAYIFPGVALGVMTARMRHISEDVFLLAAETLANTVKDEDLNVGRLYPPLTQIQSVSLSIAKRIMEVAYETGEATTYPEQVKKEEFLKAQLYNYHYSKSSPKTYTWPS